MRLVFLGTSAAQPTRKRGLSCLCLEREGEILMFDAGESAQNAYQRAGLGWNKKMRVFITHMHGDHCVGILGLLQTMSMQKRTARLEIFGPEGIEEFVAANIKMLNFGLSFPVMIETVREGEILDSAGYAVMACRAAHTVAAFSYLFEEKDRPGRFDVARAKELKVPEGPLWGRLQGGNEVTVDGQVVRPEQVLGEKRAGARIGVSGDTRPTLELERFFAGCDYLVFDSTFLDDHEERARETSHSTAGEAAALGRKAGVKNLVLTHFSARYKDESGHLAEAQRIHGSVIAARDLLEIEIR